MTLAPIRRSNRSSNFTHLAYTVVPSHRPKFDRMAAPELGPCLCQDFFLPALAVGWPMPEPSRVFDVAGTPQNLALWLNLIYLREVLRH